MKKIAASVGLIALGASCVRATADEPYVSADAGKPWKLSATLRGFYDDNINTASTGAFNHEGSFGFAVTPAASWSWQREQNTISLSYMYSLLYFDKRPTGNTSNYDQDHTFNGSFQHAFSERFQMQATDSFVIGQEPDTLRSGDAVTSSQRISGDNIRNYGTFTLTSQFTPTFGLESGYNNAYFNYDNNGATVNTNFPPSVTPSSSGTSDRIEQSIHLDARWQMLPQTIGVLGYQFSWSDYTGDELIGFVSKTSGTNIVFSPVMSDSRNSRSHYIYVGADQTFNPDLQGSARVGVRLTDYYNDPSGEKTTSPYVRLGLNYRYAPESYLESGFSFDQNSTDIVGAQGGGLTVGQESAVLFSTLHHRITPKLFGTLTGTFQNSWFVGGDLDGESQQYFLAGVNLQYRFTPNFSAEAGYDYTKVEAPNGAGPSYYKNRVYIGITGSY
jgi:hypothetical protein